MTLGRRLTLLSAIAVGATVVLASLGAYLATRAALRARGVKFTSPERRDQIAHRQAKGSRGGRPPAFDTERYTGRNVVERCFNRLKQFRAIATRYAKRVTYYRSEIIIAAIVLRLRADLQDTP